MLVTLDQAKSCVNVCYFINIIVLLMFLAMPLISFVMSAVWFYFIIR